MIALDELALADAAEDRAFLDLWIADFEACALSAADELGLFDALAGGALSVSALAAQLGLDADALLALARVLIAHGVLAESSQELALTAVGRLFWVKDSGAYRGREFHRHWDWEQHERILETLHSGWAPLLDSDESFSDAWARGSVSPESAENFTRVMHSLSLMPSLAAIRSGAFAEVRHLVDVGGGSGALAAAFLAHSCGTRATLLELPLVCTCARRILSAMAGAERLEYLPANLFVDPWPTDADAVSLSNILHDWPLDKATRILELAFAALPPGGWLFVQEALLDESRTAPRMTVAFNLLMRMNYRAQQYTRRELLELVGARGFVGQQVVHDYSYWSLLVARKPAG